MLKVFLAPCQSYGKGGRPLPFLGLRAVLRRCIYSTNVEAFLVIVEEIMARTQEHPLHRLHVAGRTVGKVLPHHEIRHLAPHALADPDAPEAADRFCHPYEEVATSGFALCGS